MKITNDTFFSSVTGFSFSLPYLKLKGSLKKCVVSCRILLVNFDDCVMILLMTIQKEMITAKLHKIAILM